MAHKIRIGTSGWNYKHWRGTFYPESLAQRDWFSYYACEFDTVEINNTFYHQPAAATFDSWRKNASKGFLYAVKANRYLTHMRKLKEPREPLKRFFSGVRRLKEKLGPVLYQLPPRWKRNLDRLAEFADALPAKPAQALEFREREWLTEDTYALMTEYELCLCVHDLLPRHPRRITGPAVYVRFHGSGQKYGGSYASSHLRRWAEWLREAAREREAYVYFNNDANAYAVRNAMTLRELVARG